MHVQPELVKLIEPANDRVLAEHASLPVPTGGEHQAILFLGKLDVAGETLVTRDDACAFGEMRSDATGEAVVGPVGVAGDHDTAALVLAEVLQDFRFVGEWPPERVDVGYPADGRPFGSEREQVGQTKGERPGKADPIDEKLPTGTAIAADFHTEIFDRPPLA